MKKGVLIFKAAFLTIAIMLPYLINAQTTLGVGNGLTPSTTYDYRVEELKVRWKKAAVENCTPCPSGPSPASFTCGTSTVTDIDGNVYNTVLIGTQCWTKENLKVTKYNDGTLIPLDISGGTAGTVSGETWSGLTSGARTVYQHNPTYLNAFGFLYNGYAAIDPKGICPTGWHVPVLSEWTLLGTQLSLSGDVGGQMMTTVGNGSSFGWNSTAKNNNSGFSALCAGYREGISNSGLINGKFDRAGIPGSSIRYTFWWSKSPATLPSYSIVNIEDQNNSSWNSTINALKLLSFGASIRCLKD